MPSTPQIVSANAGFTFTPTESLNFGALSASSFPAQGAISPTIPYQTGPSATAQAINLHLEEALNPITLAPSASQTFTLSSLTDDIGRNFSMAGGVRIFVIQVVTRAAGDHLTVAPGATHGWTSFLGTGSAMKIYDIFMTAVAQTDVYAITAGSNDQITITNSGSNNITFKIGFAGCAS